MRAHQRRKNQAAQRQSRARHQLYRGTHGAAAVACAVLLIEDNVDAGAVLGYLLTMEGHTVATAHNGAHGLALAGDFDVVICDIGLPGLDGYEVLGSLRSTAHGARPHAIARSGYCQADDRARARASQVSRTRRRATASSMRSSLVAYEKRTWRCGAAKPKSSPGTIATPVSRSTAMQKAVLSCAIG